MSVINPGKIRKDTNQLRAQMLGAIDPARHFYQLFNYLPDVGFIVKDKTGVFLFINQYVVDFWKLENEEELLGVTDFDILPKKLAEKYRKDDLQVMDSKSPMRNIIEIILKPNGIPEWFVTHKMPVFSKTGAVLGVMAVLHINKNVVKIQQTYPGITRALEYIKSRYNEDFPITELAEKMNTSTRQLERKFKEYFRTSPHQFRIKFRIIKACEMLREKKLPLSSIGLELGFYDQSSFQRHFKKIMGMTPLQYQKQH